MNAQGALAEFVEVMERLEPEPQHTRHVAFLAVRLFDETQPLHRLGPAERVLLEGAARLHDVGWPISEGGAGHHKLSARLIRQQNWRHLGRDEVEVVALVARYHRKALPGPGHEEFDRLPRPRQQVVRNLAALLRLADALDRSHLQRVRDLKVRATDRHLEISLLADEVPGREIAGAERKGDLARDVFDRALSFRWLPQRRAAPAG